MKSIFRPIPPDLFHQKIWKPKCAIFLLLTYSTLFGCILMSVSQKTLAVTFGVWSSSFFTLCTRENRLVKAFKYIYKKEWIQKEFINNIIICFWKTVKKVKKMCILFFGQTKHICLQWQKNYLIFSNQYNSMNMIKNNLSNIAISRSE